MVAPENILVSAGAKQSLYNLLFTLLNPQDEVIVLAPYWVSYPEMIKMVYGIPVIAVPEDGGFYPRMKVVEQAVSSYTKAIIVNNGISKLYGMTGFRIGWVVAPKHIVEVLANVQSQTVSCTS